MADRTPLLVNRRGDPSTAATAATRDGQPAAFLPQGRGGAGAGSKQKTVLIDEQGVLSYTQLKKHSLYQDLQLRHRDIRALEPGVALPYPAAIFVRKQALILNLEGLKLIITKDKTLVISLPLPNDLTARTLPDLQSPLLTKLASQIAVLSTSEAPNGGGLEELQYLKSQPYELRALEAALHLMASILNTEVVKLEAGTLPVLARIRRHVERDDLEMLYDTQNKLNKAVSRVTKIKEVLEELLDDPEEMEGICLSREEKLLQLARSPSLPSSPHKTPASGIGLQQSSTVMTPKTTTPSGVQEESSSMVVDDEDEDDELVELEEMIEARWLQVDSILSRLTILQERITNTEHLVNLDLDAKRNSLVALGLMTDLLLLMFEAHMMVTSIFGMNLTSGLEDYEGSLYGLAAFGLVFGAILATSIYRVAKNRGLLVLPSFGLTPAARPGAIAER